MWGHPAQCNISRAKGVLFVCGGTKLNIPVLQNCIKQGTPQLGQAALARPWDAARSLVWPSAPPGRADVLAHGTVAAWGPKITMDLAYCTAQTTLCPMNAFNTQKIPKRSSTCRAFS